MSKNEDKNVKQSLIPSKYQILRGVYDSDDSNSRSIESAITESQHSSHGSQVSRPHQLFSKSFETIWLILVALLVLIALVIWALVIAGSKGSNSHSIVSKNLDLSTLICLSNAYSDLNSSSLINFYIEPASNEIFACIAKSHIDSQTPFLFVEQIEKGVGVSTLFWDPGSIISQDLIYFSKSSENVQVKSDRIFLLAKNVNYRGASTVMKRSFADSVIWSFTVSAVDEYGYWISFDSFAKAAPGIVRGDDLAGKIASVYGDGLIYSTDASLNYVDLSTFKTNSLRSQFTSQISYKCSTPAISSIPSQMQSTVASSARSISTSIRRTFLTLTDPNANRDADNQRNAFIPRLFHPKCGLNFISFNDDSKDVFSRRQSLYFTLHNLQREGSRIQYFVDPFIPEPFRSAILEGVLWWDQAFTFAGYPAGTFNASIARDDDDPYDFSETRSHFVQWIDRDYRSYSVGTRVIDPRSGEIIRGHVRIEGLRMRQDALIAKALLSPYSKSGALSEEESLSIMSAVLQRARQVAAHEVGHSLGLAHNFAGSTGDSGYSSVMDYPPPIVRLDESGKRLILNNNSYSAGIGKFDMMTIRFGYSRIPEETQSSNQWSALLRMVDEAEAEGYVFITDQDSEEYGSDWRGTRWDHSADPMQALAQSLAVRKIALENLGVHSLGNDSALSSVLELLPIVYLWHRYEVEAVSKVLGGRFVEYAFRNDRSIKAPLPVSGAVQRRALAQLLEALRPEALALPSALLNGLNYPLAFGFESDIGGASDLFSSRTGTYNIDPLVLFESAADLVLLATFHPTRIERIAFQCFANSSLPCLSEVMQSFTDFAFVYNETALELFYVETATLQAKLVSAYINLLPPHSSPSALAASAIHSQIEYLIKIISDHLALVTGSENQQPMAFSSAWTGHLKYLSSCVSSKTAPVSSFSLPTGPPI